MTTIQSAIRSILTSDTALAALVGTRIYPGELPDNPTYPAIRYTILTSPRYEVNSVARIQFSCFATTFDQSRTIGELVEQALDRYKGVVSDLKIIRVTHVDTVQLPKEVETNLHHCAVDIRTNYQRQVI